MAIDNGRLILHIPSSISLQLLSEYDSQELFAFLLIFHDFWSYADFF